jgi:hypothetical protein
MENEKNYRNTGKSKTECQAQVDAAIAQFKLDYPGKEVPSSLINWVDNIADEADVAMAKKRSIIWKVLGA